MRTRYKVTIYYDPITRLRREGEAIIYRVLDPQFADDLVLVEVIFLGKLDPVMRRIYRADFIHRKPWRRHETT